MFIPEKIRVGFNPRYDTYTKKLGFAIPFLENKKTKESAPKKSKNFDNWIDSKIPTVDYDNTPRSGFVLNGLKGGVGSGSGWNDRQEKFRIWHPEGFEFEITTQNFMEIVEIVGLEPGKLIPGEFVLYWNAGGIGSVQLLSTQDPDYNAYYNVIETESVMSKEEILESKLDENQSLVKEFVIGQIYSDIKYKNTKYIYIGRHDNLQLKYGGSWNSTELSVVGGKHHLFIPLHLANSKDIKYNECFSKNLAKKDLCIDTNDSTFDQKKLDQIISNLTANNNIGKTFEEFKQSLVDKVPFIQNIFKNSENIDVIYSVIGELHKIKETNNSFTYVKYKEYVKNSRSLKTDSWNKNYLDPEKWLLCKYGPSEIKPDIYAIEEPENNKFYTLALENSTVKKSMIEGDFESYLPMYFKYSKLENYITASINKQKLPYSGIFYSDRTNKVAEHLPETSKKIGLKLPESIQDTHGTDILDHLRDQTTLYGHFKDGKEISISLYEIPRYYYGVNDAKFNLRELLNEKYKYASKTELDRISEALIDGKDEYVFNRNLTKIDESLVKITKEYQEYVNKGFISSIFDTYLNLKESIVKEAYDNFTITKVEYVETKFNYYDKESGKRIGNIPFYGKSNLHEVPYLINVSNNLYLNYDLFDVQNLPKINSDLLVFNKSDIIEVNNYFKDLNEIKK